MSAVQALLFGLGLVLPAEGDRAAPPPAADVAQLREMLQNEQQPLGQSQAALLLVQSRTPSAEEVVRKGLQETEAADVFLALASAVRCCQDDRFTDELLAALASDRPGIRQASAEALAARPDAQVLRRLRALTQDERAELGMRQAALWALGRSGSKQAAGMLVEQLSNGPEALRSTAAEALADLTGQTFGADANRWREWWRKHQDASNQRWLEERLAYQASRARRLEGELERSKAQVLRLHEQLYGRLPPADRLSYVRTLIDHEEAGVRGLAVGWSAELLATADDVGRLALTDLLLRLSRDPAAEVQRAAVLALGRLNSPRSFDRLQELLGNGRPSVRAAAARALAQQATPTSPENAAIARARQLQVVPALQKALDDPALEVVVEAAEDLGGLGVPEAGPVLTALLRHPSEPVRQTAARALERVADATVLDGLLALLQDSSVTVRFSLVGALGHAAGDGRSLNEHQRTALLARLVELLLRDPDPGVRSRAATVLGECGGPTHLPVLWQRLQAAEEARVQEKAWAAFITIISRSGSLELLVAWDRQLSEAKQDARRLQLLGSVCDNWKKNEDTRPVGIAATEALVHAQLEQGKWATAYPLVRELLTRPGTHAELKKRLRWLLSIGDMALREGNRPQALRVAREALPFLTDNEDLAVEFDRLEKKAQQAPPGERPQRVGS